VEREERNASGKSHIAAASTSTGIGIEIGIGIRIGIGIALAITTVIAKRQVDIALVP